MAKVFIELLFVANSFGVRRAAAPGAVWILSRFVFQSMLQPTAYTPQNLKAVADKSK